MNKKRQRATANTAVRNMSLAATNAQRATQLALGSANVIARRAGGAASTQECTRMVFEKITAAQSAWWGLGAAMMTAGPRLARVSAVGRGPFALWEASVAMSVQSTAAMLQAQRAVMAPVWSTVRANSSRLARPRR